jgi:predicted RNase H-like HicB family nuclease
VKARREILGVPHFGKAGAAVCGVVQVSYNDGMTRRYTIILEREADGGYHAFCPALPGCHTQGETEEEAMANAAEAVDLYLESLAAHNEPFPVEDLIIRPIEVAIPA